MTVKVAILGSSGRMGRNLVQAATEHKDTRLVGGSVRATSSFANVDIGELSGIGKIGINTTTDLSSLLAADVFMFFTPRQMLKS